MTSGNTNQGFASMDEGSRRESARKGGKASSASLKNDPMRTGEGGKHGSAAKSSGGKRHGGMSSHSNS